MGANRIGHSTNRGQVRALVTTLVVLAALLPGAPARAATPPQCVTRSVSVHLSPTDPAVYQVTGWACWRGTTNHKPVQLLVPGFTYDHTYWDFPLRPDLYSYVWSATAAGYVTFAIDRLGTGLSSHPLSALLTASAHAYSLHQVVTYLRSTFPGVPVLSIGHSAGSGTVLQEAASFADVSGVVLTGLLHLPDAADATLFGSFYPATLDPSFVARGYDTGYLTTLPGTRGPDFYNLAVADPTVIATDEARKSTGSAAELGSGDTALLPTTSQSIHVPVLVAVGQDDASFCDATIALSCDSAAAVLAREASNYAPDACLEAFALPASGHDINLHPNAAQWFAAANSWIDRRAVAGCAGPPG